MLSLFHLIIFHLMGIYYYHFFCQKTQNIHIKKDEAREPKEANKAFV